MKSLFLLTTLVVNFYSQISLAGPSLFCKERVHGKYIVTVDQKQNRDATFSYLIRLFDKRGRLIYNAPAEVGNSGIGVVSISGGANYPDGTQSPAGLIFTIERTGQRVQYFLTEMTYGQREVPEVSTELVCEE